MSSRIFQSVIIQMKEATTRNVGVADPEGMVVASRDLSLIGTEVGKVQSLYEDNAEKIARIDGKTFKALGVGGADDYSVFAEGEDELARTICYMAVIAINEAGIFFEENHDKRAFIKNVITENILPGEIYVRSKELRFVNEVTRGVLVIRNSSTMEPAAIDLIAEEFPDKQHDFVILVSNSSVAVVKELPSHGDVKALQKLAEILERKLDSELSMDTVIGIGTPARHLRELAAKYKEAMVSIEVGRVFEPQKTIISYESLGIGRLIYKLPTTLCEIFLSEAFKSNPIEILDHETLFMIDKLFENSLNVSQTARKLFVHRNTIVYRLDKVKRITGLDLREFDHAIIFKVAFMVRRYLISQESKY